MSSIRLGTSEDIVKFLKILAEESVASAKEDIKSDSAQQSVEQSMKSDSKTWGALDEVEEEGPEGDEESTEEDEAPEEEPVSLEVSLDSLTTAVKELRSGRSVDDQLIKKQLTLYFDRLDPAEREALLAFLRAFGGILTGRFQGGDAPDPSDSPYSISITKSGEEEELAVSDEEVPEEEGEEGEEVPEDEEVPEEEDEDTSPPIKAGGGQELAEIRLRVRELMKK